MKNHLIAILFIAMVVLFFVGRWTAPEPVDPRDKAEIEQLKREKANAWQLLNQAVDSMNVYKKNADAYRNRAILAEMDKILNQTKYEASVYRIDAYTPDQLDSLLIARYPDSLYRSAPQRPEGSR